MANPLSNLSANKVIILGIVAAVVGAFLIFSGVFQAPEAKAGASDNMSGFAWSSNFGWISFNRTDCDANNDGLSDGAPAGCPPSGTSISNYGVNLDSATKFLTGYAWYGWDDGGTNQGGWIQFGGLTGFPTGPGTSAQNAQLNASNQLIGWARALSFSDPQAGGWDGWISLRGTADDGSTYGVILNGNSFEGYSWDGSNTVITVPPAADQFDGVGIGWITWKHAFGGVVISGSAPTVDLLIDGGNGPNPYTEPASYTLSWITANSPTSCTASGGDPTWTASPSKNPTGDSQSFSNISAGTYTYTLTCSNLIDSGVDSVTANVYVAATVNLTAAPGEVEEGESTTLSWTTSDIQPGSCVLDGPNHPNESVPNTGSLDSGPLSGESTFTLTCTSLAGVPVPSSVTISIEEGFIHL